jgi:DNA-binding SARP family transcriptional activator
MAREGLAAGLLRVVAGAGYGKTTLLAQAVAGLEEPAAWVACDPRPGRPSLVDALAGALAGALPGLAAPPRRAGPERRAASLCEEIAARADAGLVLVVDDAHLLLGGRGERELAALARELPAGARLAVASRWTLPEPLGSPRPDAVTLGEPQLALSAEEARELLAALGSDASAEEAAERGREAEGWMAGIVLAARPGGDPLDYLLREVVDPLPQAAADLLEDTSHLDRFTPDMAARVTGRDDAAELLDLLEARRAFLAPAEGGPGWRRHHRLLRAALQRRAASRPAARTADIHRRAAQAWDAVGEREPAARHHLAAGDLSAAVAALAAVGGGHAGLRRPMEDWLRAVPAGAWSDLPGPVLAQASQLFYRADHRGAFAAMESAARELLARGDRHRAAVVLVRLLRAAPLAGGIYDRTIAAARDLVPRLDGEDPILLAAARVMLALLLGESCRRDEAEHELGAALDAAPDEPLAAAWAAATRAFTVDHPQGRRPQALAALDGAIPLLEEGAGVDPLNYLLYARAFRSLILSDAGRFADALDEADRLGAAAAERGLARLGVAVVAMLRFVPLAGLGQLDRLGTELARSAPDFRRMAGALRGYRHDVAAAQLAAATGDHTGVTRGVEAAREGLAEHGLPYDSAMALADLAGAAAAAELRETAWSLADEARAMAERAGAPWALARTAMVAAAVRGPGPEGDAALADALRRSADPRLEALWSRRERSLATVLLPRALERDVGPREAVVRLARACGGEVLDACAERAAGSAPEVRLALAEAAAGAVASDRAIGRMLEDPDAAVRGAARRVREARRRGAPGRSVRLVTLGGFAVERDGQRVADAEFGRQKARALLALLACAGRAVHREELVGALWPDLTERRGIAALHSTLYALRRVLEPHLLAGDASALVVAEGPTYRLVVGELGGWDADEFLRAAAAGLSAQPPDALPLLRTAEARYAGPLLPEWSFAPWTQPLRTELEEAHRAVLVAMAERLAEAGRAGEAISRYRLLLALEPEREGWHRALMSVYADAGERALALRQFHACRTVLRERLGVAPSRETRELHTRILREG